MLRPLYFRCKMRFCPLPDCDHKFTYDNKVFGHLFKEHKKEEIIEALQGLGFKFNQKTRKDILIEYYLNALGHREKERER